MQPFINAFLMFLNPKMNYDLTFYIYWTKLIEIEMFQFSDEAEIMQIATRMKP